MTTCPSCGNPVSANVDFCSCGEYIRWEPTGFMPALQPDGTPVGAGDLSADQPTGASLVAEGAASVTLRMPGESTPTGDAPLLTSVVPGSGQTILALIRNQSGIVDNYDIDVDGIPADWWTAKPETVYLVPFGTSGVYEQEIEIELHPPRTPEAEARIWELEVVAHSRAADGAAAAAPVHLTVLPFELVEIKPTPQRRVGRRRARYDVTIRNRANAPVTIALAARDADGECRTSFTDRTVTIPAGRRKETKLQVRPPRQRLIGRPLDWRIEVLGASGEEGEQLHAEEDARTAGRKRRGFLGRIPGLRGPRITRPDLVIGPDGVRLAGPRISGPSMGQVRVGGRMPALDPRKLRRGAPVTADQPLLPTQVIFRQRAWLPWWLAVVIPLLLMLLLMLWLLWPRTTTVPRVTGLPSVFAAQERLEAKHLSVDPSIQRVVRPAARPGSIVGQAPKAGLRVDKGSAVVLQIAVGTTSVKVPAITGKTLPQAEQALRTAGLIIGRTSVTPPNLKAPITSQIPAAGQLVREGSPIDVYYGKAGKKGAGAAGAAAGGGGGGGDITVPEIDPKDAQGYAAKVSDAGLVPQPVQAFSPAPKGTVVQTKPAVGTKVQSGSAVRLIISAGFPQLIYDDDKDVLRIDGATGKRLTPIAHSDTVERDPTWAADGTHIAFEQGGQIMLATLAKPMPAPVAITEDGFVDPAFAPTPESLVLAVARRNTTTSRNDTDLCVGLVTAEGLRPQCIADKDTGIGDPQWSPDGKTILASAVSKDHGFGIVQYRSQVPFSPRASDWTGGEFVTPTDPSGATGVSGISISPDGKRVAVINNLDSGEFRLAITTIDDLRLEQARRLPVQACKAVWRPDGKELVIVQAGALCTQRTGQLFRIAADRTAEAVPLSASGDNPSFEPLAGS